MKEIHFDGLPNDASGLLRRMASELVCPIWYVGAPRFYYRIASVIIIYLLYL
jgi:hypothetical protein